MLDKNGNPLKGGAVWLRIIANNGGFDAHNKKIAMGAFESFLDSYPDVASVIAKKEVEEKRSMFKIVKSKNN